MDAMSLTIFDQTDITTTQQPPQLDTVAAAAEHFQVNFSFFFTFLTSCYFYMEISDIFVSQEFVVDHDDTMEPSAAATLVLSAAAATHELATAAAGVDDTDNTQHNNRDDVETATDADIVSATSVIISQAAANEDAATLEDVDDAKQQPVVVVGVADNDFLHAGNDQVNDKAAAAETDSQTAGSSSEDITSEIKDGEQSGETTATDTDTTTPIQMDSQ